MKQFYILFILHIDNWSLFAQDCTGVWQKKLVTASEVKNGVPKIEPSNKTLLFQRCGKWNNVNALLLHINEKYSEIMSQISPRRSYKL